MAIALPGGDVPEISSIEDRVAGATDTPSDHIVCSALAMQGDFNCLFFGDREDDEYPVLLVYGRSHGGAPEIMLALTTSTLGPEDVRHLVSDRVGQLQSAAHAA